MIRVLQQNNKIVKILFAVIIGAAVVTMVITLVPGIFDNVGVRVGITVNYATVHRPGVLGRFETEPVLQTEVDAGGAAADGSSRSCRRSCCSMWRAGFRSS